MFGFHPVNLAFRFLLELGALVAIGVGAHHLSTGALAWVLAIVVPLVVAVAWGLFNVPGDRSRSGSAPVPVDGRVRLVLEIVVFAGAAALLWPVSRSAASLLVVGVVGHYALSVDRVRWLLER